MYRHDSLNVQVLLRAMSKFYVDKLHEDPFGFTARAVWCLVMCFHGLFLSGCEIEFGIIGVQSTIR